MLPHIIFYNSIEVQTNESQEQGGWYFKTNYLATSEISSQHPHLNITFVVVVVVVVKEVAKIVNSNKL